MMTASDMLIVIGLLTIGFMVFQTNRDVAIIRDRINRLENIEQLLITMEKYVDNTTSNSMNDPMFGAFEIPMGDGPINLQDLLGKKKLDTSDGENRLWDFFKKNTEKPTDFLNDDDDEETPDWKKKK